MPVPDEDQHRTCDGCGVPRSGSPRAVLAACCDRAPPWRRLGGAFLLVPKLRPIGSAVLGVVMVGALATRSVYGVVAGIPLEDAYNFFQDTLFFFSAIAMFLYFITSSGIGRSRGQLPDDVDHPRRPRLIETRVEARCWSTGHRKSARINRSAARTRTGHRRDPGSALPPRRASASSRRCSA